MNLLDVVVTARADGRLVLDGPGFAIEPPPFPVTPRLALLLGVRPRDVVLVDPGDGDTLAQIVSVEPLGHETVVQARIEAGGRGPEVTIVAGADTVRGVSETVGLRFRREHLHLFRADDGRRVTDIQEE
jgi:ABC-type sugar transport system ATPase subunit